MFETEETGVNKPDWQEIRQRFEAGVNLAQLARDTGLTRSQLGYRRRKEQWQVTQQLEKNIRVWESVGEISERLESKAECAGEADGDLEGRGFPDQRIMGHSPAPRAPAPAPGQELDPLSREVAKEIALLMDHQRQVGRARRIATDIITRLEDVLIRGETNATVRVRQTANGKEFLLPFLGHRESVSDALVKVANALQRLVPLERQAHGLLPKDQSQESLPAVTVNIGTFAIGKREDGARAGAKPGRVIESEASAIKDATQHLN